MSAPAAAPRLEIDQLKGRGAKLFIQLYFVTTVVLALWTIDTVDTPWLVIVALAMFAGVMVALSLDRGPVLSKPVTALVMVTGPLATAMMCAHTTPGGYSEWYIGAGTVSLFYASLRGRIPSAWVAFVALAGVILVCEGHSSEALATSIVTIGRQAAVLLIGTLFAVSLHRASRVVERLNVESSARAAREAAADAAAAERSHRLAQLDDVATPLLRKLADGGPLTEDDRSEFATAEAALRDSLRARTLCTPEVVDAARAARLRGVDVILLDDSTPGTISGEALALACLAVTRALTIAVDGRVTARLLPGGRQHLATIVEDGSSHYAKQELALP